jgi:hypothetical protein
MTFGNSAATPRDVDYVQVVPCTSECRMPFAPSPTDGSLPTDLVLLAAERAVTVTREEHHQDVLSGRTGRAVVELRPCLITSGKHAGQDGLGVVLDGRRVGELTRLMAQRYRPMVDH